MSVREALPPPWLLAVTVLGGLLAGVVYALAGGAPEEAVPVPVPVAPSPPPAPAFSIPGAPPPEIARDLEPVLRDAFRPGREEPEVQAAREAAFERLKALVGKWAAASPRDPLASAPWWRAALRGAQPTGEGDRRGMMGGAIPWLGRPFPVLFSVPEGPGPFPAVVALVDGEPYAEAERGWKGLLATHILALVPRPGPVASDPRLAMLALSEAGRRWGVDRDRVVLDGTGGAAEAVAALAAEESRRLCGVVLRGPHPPAGPSENLALLPVLAALPEGASAEAEAAIRDACPSATVRRGASAADVAEWIASLPPRRSADPREPVIWATTTGEQYKSWGPGFVVRRYRGTGAGRPVRVSLQRDAERNAVILRTENVAEIVLLLTDEGLDLDRPVTVIAEGEAVEARKVGRSLDTLRTWALQEPGLLVTAEMVVRLPE